MSTFSIAGIQMPVSATVENVSAMRRQVNIAVARFPWIDMVVFSELAAYGPLYHQHPAEIESTIEIFQKQAQKHKIWIIPGSMFEKRSTGIYNTSVVINPEGKIVGRYDKMFPFMPYETEVTGGTDFLIWDVPNIGRFGLSICYDIWFPETTRTLASLGAEVLIHPVLTGTTDRDVELAIARATAAQFQCYVFDINGIGAGGIGRSCVVGPGGNILYEARGSEEIIPIEVDLEQVRRQREKGQNGLGQVLKSWRDRNAEFGVYDRATADNSYLESLGPLQMPTKNTYVDQTVSDPSQLKSGVVPFAQKIFGGG